MRDEPPPPHPSESDSNEPAMEARIGSPSRPSIDMSSKPAKPFAVTLFTIYLLTLTLMAVFTAITGLAMVAQPGPLLQELEATGRVNQPGVPNTVAGLQQLGWTYGVIGIVTLALALGWWLIPAAMKWWYGVVLICLPLPLLATLVLILPLLYVWSRPPVRLWYAERAAAEAAAKNAWAQDERRDPWG